MKTTTTATAAANTESHRDRANTQKKSPAQGPGSSY
jgi:hypothetical protein